MAPKKWLRILVIVLIFIIFVVGALFYDAYKTVESQTSTFPLEKKDFEE